MTPPIARVRPLEEHDLPALLALYEQLHLADDAHAPGSALAVWRHILTQPWIVHLGVFAGETLAAACHAVIVPNLTHGARPYAIIEGVITHDAHRRQGHGATAMRALIARCWDAGCYKVSLTSSVKRAEAHAFYRRLGFTTGNKHAFVLLRDAP
ncbi:MAG: GNAT family N-acetyltransferase [Polyangiales bacterium]